jgi:tetratricopeptide (TPR) repeat protein
MVMQVNPSHVSVLRRAPRRARFLALLPLLLAGTLRADLIDAQKLYDSGKYADCIAACEAAIAPATAPSATATAPDPFSILIPLLPAAAAEEWWQLKAKAELQTGKYDAAEKTTAAGIANYATSLPLYLLRHQALRMVGRPDDAATLLTKVQDMVLLDAWRYENPDNRVALGQFMIIRGTDARQVLENYFDRARRDAPRNVNVHMATGNLALAKNDPGVAADSFETAQRLAPDNPDVYFGIARANDDDPELVTAALAKALELNPNHIDSMLLIADNLISRDRHKDAAEMLDKVLAVNPKEPRAWAYRAVMAHLKGDRKGEEAARATALSTWKSNPEVDFLIGRKLSQNYRFEVGNNYQKKSLAFDATYQPAQFQLAQDLLRIGEEEEGWRLADEVFKKDPYNVMAFNLVTLRDRIARFKTLSNPRFIIRMDAKEAPIYGQRVLDLLDKAHTHLTSKYGVQLKEPTTIEIFPLQQDFEIRTFGWPGEEGYLGVCFGRVVTVNSPASRLAHPTSWESILWHEFCHTVTLTKTHNKMPRWISEGISVYEERLANPAWGDHMIPAYRDLIKKDGATKIAELSQAFSQPPSPMHLQFAYFQASMVVEYAISRFGIDAVRGVLADLGDDIMINEALAKRFEPIEKLEENFAVWFKAQADALAPKVNWEEPKLLPEDGSGPLTAWNKDNPNSFWGLIYEGEALLIERKLEEAKAVLIKARDLFPRYGELDGPYLILAKINRDLKKAAEEVEALEAFCALNSDTLAPRVRLMEIGTEAKDWKLVRKYAEQAIAVDPLTQAPYRFLAESAEALGDRATAIDARRTILLLEPLDLPEQHYRLAKLLYEDGKIKEARHEVVLALEDAPRYREALALLLKIADVMDAANPSAAPASQPVLPSAEVRPLQEPK